MMDHSVDKLVLSLFDYNQSYLSIKSITKMRKNNNQVYDRINVNLFFDLFIKIVIVIKMDFLVSNSKVIPINRSD